MANHWTIATMQAALQQDETSAVETISSCLTTIDKEDGEGARTFVRSFKNTAITQAAASDTLRKMKVPQGPLAGIPISVKDLFDVEGEPTTAGSKALSNIARPATRDALVVARLRAAGAILVGHTNMTELAYSGLGINPHFGTPLNGWERSRGACPRRLVLWCGFVGCGPNVRGCHRDGYGRFGAYSCRLQQALWI